jgi:molybdenum cofactor biosynthesis protein A
MLSVAEVITKRWSCVAGVSRRMGSRVVASRRAQSTSQALLLEEKNESEYARDGIKTQANVQTHSGHVANRPRLESLRDKLKTSPVAVTTFSRDATKSPSSGAASRNQATQNSKGCGAAGSPSAASVEENMATTYRIIDELKQKKKKENVDLLTSTATSPAMLTDNFGRQHTYLRISLTERCNLRCQYCMPPEGVPLQDKQSLLESQEIIQLVNLFASKGVNKIRLTGGEPLLRPDIIALINQISTSHPDMKSIGITTNGLTLGRKLPALVDAGLTHINISLDTLQEDKFLEITRRKGLNVVMEAIKKASTLLPLRRVKINCVVMKGFNDDELQGFVRLTEHLPIDVRFIEWMPFNDNGWNADRFFSYADMLDRIQGTDPKATTQQPIALERTIDGPNDTTKWYTVPGYLGRVGFITSMSDHFCGTCNRVRITADGQLKVCLFGSDEVSLRDALRAGVPAEDLELLVEAAVKRKNFALGGHGDMHGIKKANSNRPMILIGG